MIDFFCQFNVIVLTLTFLLFRFELVPDSKEGTVFPPLITITYSDIPIADVATQTVSVSQANTHVLTFIFLSGLSVIGGQKTNGTTTL